MGFAEAQKLRQELEAIEATMRRIKDLWLSEDFPRPNELEDLAKELGDINATMEQIIEKAEDLPTAESIGG